MEQKVRTEVDVKHFGGPVVIEKEFEVGSPDERYVYQVNYQNRSYILKGFKIELEHLDPENDSSAEFFKASLIQISEVFQEYYFSLTTSPFNPHIAAPLAIDYKIEVAKKKGSDSYMYIEIIFEYAGISLSNIKPLTIELTYNLMRQSANALFLLHNLGIAHFDIKPDNLVYDSKKDLLKIIDMGSAFGRGNKSKLAATTKKLNEKVREATLEFAPPEVLSIENPLASNRKLGLSLPAIDVYYWGMSFFAVLTDRKNADLKKYYTKYRSKSEKEYKEFMKAVKDNCDLVKPKDSTEKNLLSVIIGWLDRALKYEPKERPEIKVVINEMKKFEEEKKYSLKFSEIELEHKKRLLNLLMIDSKTLKNDKGNSMVALGCRHEICKDYLVSYALELFLKGKPYEYSCLCTTCKKVSKLKSLPLSCGCIWKWFGEKIKFTDIKNAKCSEGKHLTSIDIGLVNDFISYELAISMVFDYPGEKENTVVLDLLTEAVTRKAAEDKREELRKAKDVPKAKPLKSTQGVDSNKRVDKEEMDSKSHRTIPIGGYYEELVTEQQIRKNHLLSSRRVLDYASSDLEVIKDLIANKNKKMTDAIEALKRLNAKIAAEEIKVEKLQASLLNSKAQVEEIKELPIENIMKLKNELKEISGDVNIQCMGEAAVLALMITNQRLELELLPSVHKSTHGKDIATVLNSLKDKITALSNNQVLITKNAREGKSEVTTSLSFATLDQARANKAAINDLKNEVENNLKYGINILQKNADAAKNKQILTNHNILTLVQNLLENASKSQKQSTTSNEWEKIASDLQKENAELKNKLASANIDVTKAKEYLELKKYAVNMETQYEDIKKEYDKYKIKGKVDPGESKEYKDLLKENENLRDQLEEHKKKVNKLSEEQKDTNKSIGSRGQDYKSMDIKVEHLRAIINKIKEKKVSIVNCVDRAITLTGKSQMPSHYLEKLKNDINEIYKLIETDTSSSTPIKQPSPTTTSNKILTYNTTKFSCDKCKKLVESVTKCNACSKSFCELCFVICNKCKPYGANRCSHYCPLHKAPTY